MSRGVSHARARADHQKHQAEDGGIDRVFRAGRMVLDRVARAAMSEDARDAHRDDEHQTGRTSGESEREE